MRNIQLMIETFEIDDKEISIILNDLKKINILIGKPDKGMVSTLDRLNKTNIEKGLSGVEIFPNFEIGLHYSEMTDWWNKVWEYLQEHQFFGTTQSIEVIRAITFCDFFTEGDNVRVYRIELSNNKYTVVKYDKETIRIAVEDGWEMR